MLSNCFGISHTHFAINFDIVVCSFRLDKLLILIVGGWQSWKGADVSVGEEGHDEDEEELELLKNFHAHEYFNEISNKS